MALGLIVCFISGGRVNGDTTTVVDKSVSPFCLVYPSHVFLFFSIPGERKRRREGGVTWYLLVAIPHPPDIPLHSPGMIGVLDVAGWQERFSANTYTTYKCLYWKKESFSEASLFIWLNWSCMGPNILWRSCRLFCRNHPHRFPVEYCHRKSYFIHSIHTNEFNAKETRCIATTTFVSQTHEKIAALRLVGDACRYIFYVIRHYYL